MEQDKRYLQVLFDSIENHNFMDHKYWVSYMYIFIHMFDMFFTIYCNRSSYSCNVLSFCTLM